MRQICSVVQVGTSDYKKLVNKRGTASGWVAGFSGIRRWAKPRHEARPARHRSRKSFRRLARFTLTPQRRSIHSLDDLFFDVEGWLAEEIATEFAQEENAAFLHGNGTNKPKGLLTYTTAATADASRTFGQIEHIPTGVADNWPAADGDTADLLIDVVHKLRPRYRRGARWLMKSTTLSTIRKLSTSIST